MNRHLMASAVAAALALIGTGASAAHADQHVQAHWSHPSMHYGGEATVFADAPPTGALDRDEVVAELHQWQTAGAWDAGGEAGPSRQVLEQRTAMNRLESERHARALALEEERRAAAAREAESTQIATASDTATRGSVSDADRAAYGMTDPASDASTATSGAATTLTSPAAVPATTTAAADSTPLPADRAPAPLPSSDMAVQSSGQRADLDASVARDASNDMARPLDDAARPAQ